MSGHPGQLGSKPREVNAHYDLRFLEDLDGRSAVARELRDRLKAFADDLGGWNSLSYMQRAVAKRAVHMERAIEVKERRLSQGLSVDENKYTNLVATWSGLLSKVNPGLKRKVKVLTLEDYQKSKTVEKATPPPVHIVEQEPVEEEPAP